MLLACLLVGLRWWYAFLSGWVTLAAHVDHSDLVSFVVVVSLGHFISLYRSLSALLLLNSSTRETLCRLGFVSFVLVAGRWSCPVCLKGLMKTLSLRLSHTSPQRDIRIRIRIRIRPDDINRKEEEHKTGIPLCSRFPPWRDTHTPLIPEEP